MHQYLSECSNFSGFDNIIFFYYRNLTPLNRIKVVSMIPTEVENILPLAKKFLASL